MSISKLTRRALVASTAAMPAVAVLPIAAQAATEPDPAFALIERFKEASQFMEGRRPLKNRRLTSFEISTAASSQTRSARK
jgi:hypothetical protein